MTSSRDGPTAQPRSSRRRFLAVAAGGTIAGVSGVGSVQGQSQAKTIRLGGQTAGWLGRAPQEIADETNPTLELEDGRDYRITWENADGADHNIEIRDENETTLERTEIISERGATQTLEFTAEEKMATYLCEVHPTSMRGDIRFGDSETTTTTAKDSNAQPYVSKGPSVRLETVVDGDGDLAQPVDFEIPPDGTDRRFIADRLGQVYVHDTNGMREEPFIDVTDRLIELSGEVGLLGMAFHPDYEKNGKFYLRYSAPRRDGTPEEFHHTEVLAEFTVSGDGKTADLDSERTILEIPSPYDTHNAGAVTFGPDDGYLYMGMGDGGNGKDIGTGHVSDWYDANEGGNGQDVTKNLLGSILRIDVDGEQDGKPYAIPEDNPLVGKAGLNEHYAWGFRNPWRMSFNDGKLFVADVGQAQYEEVNIVEKGKNYGWNVKEGTHCFNTDDADEPRTDCPDSTPTDVRGGESLIDPIIEYPHNYEGRALGSAVIGGYVYNRDDIPTLQGKYIFGDFRTGKGGEEVESGMVYAATPNDDGLWELEEIVFENRENGVLGAYPPAFGRDSDGHLYVLTQQLGAISSGTGGAVHRIRPPENPQQANGENATTATTSNSTTTTTAANTTITTGMNANTANDTAGGANTTDKSSDTTTGGSGPGFGALAAIGALAFGAVRLLTGRED